MSCQRRSKVFFVVLFLVVLIVDSARWEDSVAALRPVSIATTTAAATQTPNALTSLPKSDDQPRAWVDESIDLEQFSPTGLFIVHFNKPMDEGSSLTPLLAWPSMEGSSSWDIAHTTLTFSPTAALNNNAVYTFFLDPALRSASGEALDNPPEWQVLTRSGPEVVRIFPSAGDLDRRYAEIRITFDQEMVTDIDRELISIEPATTATLNWI